MNSIKLFRIKAGFSQAELGQKLKTGQSTVAMWETGESLPRAAKLLELAKILGCTVDELLQEQKETA